jgi:hypothetical protein
MGLGRNFAKSLIAATAINAAANWAPYKQFVPQIEASSSSI